MGSLHVKPGLVSGEEECIDQKGTQKRLEYSEKPVEEDGVCEQEEADRAFTALTEKLGRGHKDRAELLRHASRS